MARMAQILARAKAWAGEGHTESTEGLARRPEGESQITERRIVDDSDE